MVVLVDVLDEDCRPVQIEVDENTRATVLATRELTRAISRLAAIQRVGK